MKTIFVLLLFVLALLTGCREVSQSRKDGTVDYGSTGAKQIVGKVVAVSDGDTATVLDGNNVQHKIRFLGIDAPEKSQAFGQKAKQNLSDLIFGKTVTVQVIKRDKYGRAVGKILLDGRDINLQQVKDGFAWHYKEYQREQSDDDRQVYSQTEFEARKARRGLWLVPHPQSPSDFRKSERLK